MHPGSLRPVSETKPSPGDYTRVHARYRVAPRSRRLCRRPSSGLLNRGGGEARPAPTAMAAPTKKACAENLRQGRGRPPVEGGQLCWSRRSPEWWPTPPRPSAARRTATRPPPRMGRRRQRALSVGWLGEGLQCDYRGLLLEMCAEGRCPPVSARSLEREDTDALARPGPNLGEPARRDSAGVDSVEASRQCLRESLQGRGLHAVLALDSHVLG